MSLRALYIIRVSSLNKENLVLLMWRTSKHKAKVDPKIMFEYRK